MRRELQATLGLVVLAVLSLSVAPANAIDTIHLVGAGDIAEKVGGAQVGTAAEVSRLNPTAVFTTGDNVYPDGTLSDFNAKYNPSWGAFKSITNPSPGNHDYRTAGASGYFGYFGVAPYYRYTLGTWEVYSLNSEIAHGSSSPEVVWLKQQLAAHPAQCIAAYWHKPRYSSGTSHGSNTGVQPFLTALAAAHADVVMNGHVHNYERFAPVSGIREFVVGTGGAHLTGFGTTLAGSEKRIMAYGVLDLGLNDGSYTWAFNSSSNTTLDSGTGTC